MSIRIPLALASLCALAAAPVLAQSAAVAQAAAPRAETPRAPYLIGAGDVLDVKFTYNPELDEHVTVRPDGAISLPMVGDIAVQGLSPAVLSADITRRFQSYLNHSQAVVIVREFASERVYVGGEVNAPTVIGLRGVLTVTQALFNAGGLKTSARLDSVLLLHYAGGNRTEVRRLDLRNVLKGRQADLVLQPYDVVFVPRSKIARVGLWVQQYVNDVIPKALLFPYNINNVVNVHQ